MAKRARRAEGEPRDPDAPLHTRLDCKPDVCEMQPAGEFDTRTEEFGKVANFSCDRCGFSTTDAAEAKRLNPDLRGA